MKILLHLHFRAFYVIIDASIRSYANYNKNSNVAYFQRTIVKEESTMANELRAVSDGTFTLHETENKNQFYFYRNDGQVLADIDREPMDLYHAYIMQKMMSGEITDVVMNNIYSEISEDGKCIRLTICDIGEKPEHHDNSTVSKQPNFLKRFFHKVFG